MRAAVVVFPGSNCDRDTRHVLDDVVGIPADFVPHLFERFTQSDAPGNRRHGGLGLGLSIVKHLVDLHGGAVGAASEGEGQGATMRVELPVEAVGAAAADDPDSEVGPEANDSDASARIA